MFGDAKMTTALLDRLTHHRHISRDRQRIVAPAAQQCGGEVPDQGAETRKRGAAQDRGGRSALTRRLRGIRFGLRLRGFPALQWSAPRHGHNKSEAKTRPTIRYTYPQPRT